MWTQNSAFHQFKTYLRIGLICSVLATCSAEVASAHFVWVYVDGEKVKVVFGEDLAPDQAQFLSGLNGMKSYVLREGSFQDLAFTQKTEGDNGWFEADFSPASLAVDVTCEYGLFGRGDKKMLLDYSAKYLRLAAGTTASTSGQLKLDLVPTFTEGKLTISAQFNGSPVSGVEIEVEEVEVEPESLETNLNGVATLSGSARYIIRGKHTLAEAGEFDGQKFEEKRYYCTLVLDVANEITSQISAKADAIRTQSVIIEKVKTNFEQFPKGMTSFGAAVSEGQVFVMGGKSGRAHSYARSYQNRDVFCLNLSKGGSNWQTVGETLGLQGLAVVSHQNMLYRVGGLEARNQEGEDHDLHSVADVLQFDPNKQTWQKMPSLPEGRSSFDACVAGDKLYVVGGWQMRGDMSSQWAEDVLVLDLNEPESGWNRIDAPFRTRALAVREYMGQLVVVGGIDEEGGPSEAVNILDLKTNKWMAGPDVPVEGRMRAFGCSAVVLGDHFLVSTYDGEIFRLIEDGKGWEKVHQLENGRFFHQMIPVSESRFALIGGSHMSHGSQLEVEVFELK